VLEEHYVLVSRLNITWSEVRNLPIPYRRWLIHRIIKDLEASKKQSENNSSQQTPEASLRDVDKFSEQMMRRFDKSSAP
jgi:hypothetical protein